MEDESTEVGHEDVDAIGLDVLVDQTGPDHGH